MISLSRLGLITKALLQLDPNQIGSYALYQLGLRTGYFQRSLNSALAKLEKVDQSVQNQIYACLPEPPESRALLELIGNAADQLFIEADEIVHGYVRLFGGKAVPLELILSNPLENWMKYENRNNIIHDQDIKFIWEPGRFGWACKLAMAYHLSSDERYSASFWVNAEDFLNSNPPYRGPHWSSAQEVAIRLIVLAFVIQIFAGSEQLTRERLEMITKAIAVHAERIPSTLVYARSQNNNHLITEALALYTSSATLMEHPLASQWHTLGWKWLNHAFLTQISPDGSYTQHSINYHRLMLQSALWAYSVQQHAFKDEPFSPDVITRLSAATRWLWKLVDPETGRVPNLGHNDGAYILPLSVCPYHDYRPVIHAASQAFLQTNLTPKGPWDDMTSWFCLPEIESNQESKLDYWHKISPPKDIEPQSPFILINHKNNSWASLNAEKYDSRPAHADQLHLDLWWKGMNIAQDAGTFAYNAQPPWNNSLTSALVHNTAVIDGMEFMQRADRFLYLDWAQGSVIAHKISPQGGWESLTALHDGYKNIGVSHSRMVTANPDGHWEIIDLLDGPVGIIHTARLHWLLPDWEYDLPEPSIKNDLPVYEIRIKSPYGWIGLKMSVVTPHGYKPSSLAINFQLARAGTSLHGDGIVPPIIGWTSPTYGDKIPALACIIEVSQALPIDLRSEWIIPSES